MCIVTVKRENVRIRRNRVQHLRFFVTVLSYGKERKLGPCSFELTSSCVVACVYQCIQMYNVGSCKQN